MQDVLLQEDFNGYSKRFSVVNGELKALQNYEDKEDSITFIQYQAGARGLTCRRPIRLFILLHLLVLNYMSRVRREQIDLVRTKLVFIISWSVRTQLKKIYRTLAMRRDYTEALFEEGE